MSHDDLVKRLRELAQRHKNEHSSALADIENETAHLVFSNLDAIERLSAENAALKYKLKLAFSEDDKLIVMKEMQEEINGFKARIAELEASHAELDSIISAYKAMLTASAQEAQEAKT